MIARRRWKRRLGGGWGRCFTPSISKVRALPSGRGQPISRPTLARRIDDETGNAARVSAAPLEAVARGLATLLGERR